MEEIKEVAPITAIEKKEKTSFYQDCNPFELVIDVPGHSFCWIRHCMPGFREDIQKDWKNLERAVGGGWNPVTVSPHPKLKVNSYGYISHGDVVLCGRIVPNMLESEAGRIQDENIKRKRIS